MMTTVQALVWSGILTLLMVLVASGFCAKVWEPGGVMVAFGNREGVVPPIGMAGRADRAAREHARSHGDVSRAGACREHRRQVGAGCLRRDNLLLGACHLLAGLSRRHHLSAHSDLVRQP